MGATLLGKITILPKGKMRSNCSLELTFSPRVKNNWVFKIIEAEKSLE